jgi:hypothetical protein
LEVVNGAVTAVGGDPAFAAGGGPTFAAGGGPAFAAGGGLGFGADSVAALNVLDGGGPPTVFAVVVAFFSA